jgi:hypothetical protein
MSFNPDLLRNPKKADRGVLFLLRVCSSVSVVFVGLILLFGCLKLLLGSLEFIGFHFCPDNFFNDNNIFTYKYSPYDSLPTLLGGLEYFLLAPLCYLQLRTIANYIEVLVGRGDGDDDAAFRALQSKEKKELLSVKGLSVGLLIMILATHLLGGFLKDAGSHTPTEMIGFAVKNGCGIILLGALIFYFAVIERHASTH